MEKIDMLTSLQESKNQSLTQNQEKSTSNNLNIYPLHVKQPLTLGE